MWWPASCRASAALLAIAAFPAAAQVVADTQWLALRLNGVEQEQVTPALPVGGGYALPVEVWSSLRLQLPGFE